MPIECVTTRGCGGNGTNLGQQSAQVSTFHVNVDQTSRVRLAHGLATSEGSLERVTNNGASVSDGTVILHGSVLTGSKTRNRGDGDCGGIGGSRGHACSNRRGGRGRRSITYSPNRYITARCRLQSRHSAEVGIQKCAGSASIAYSLENVRRATSVRMTHFGAMFSSQIIVTLKNCVCGNGGCIGRIDLTLH